jgi:HNH endonuclease/AP2 domain
MADINSTLSKELLHEYFEYRDGELYWKISPTNSVKFGQKAGCLDTNGYYKTSINGKDYGNHRIIFAMHYGFFPKMIDHIDRNPSNNKIENLRAANDKQNQWNTEKNSRNTSGYKNVLFRKERNKWTCRFKVNGKHIMRGSFDTPEEANLYAEKLRKELHGEYSL